MSERREEPIRGIISAIVTLPGRTHNEGEVKPSATADTSVMVHQVDEQMV